MLNTHGIQKILPESESSSATANIYTMSFTGYLCGPILGGVVSYFGSYRIAFITLVFFCVIKLLFWYCFIFLQILTKTVLIMALILMIKNE